MTDIPQKPESAEKLHAFLDWAVFSLGVMSLSLAIGATVLSKTSLLG